jgi:hypothetical protein
MSRRDWIEEYARKELGMAPPKADQMADEDDLDDVVGPPVDGTIPAAAPQAEQSAAEVEVTP